MDICGGNMHLLRCLFILTSFFLIVSSYQVTKSGIYILGTVINSERFIDKVVGNFLKVAALFNDYRIVCFAGKSTDNTTGKLYSWRSLDANIVILENITEVSGPRTSKISNARNSLLQYVKRHNSNLKWKYFIMADMDDTNAAPIKTDILKFHFKKNTEWDAVSFNRRWYYDLWALSIHPYLISCFHWDKLSLVLRKMQQAIDTALLNMSHGNDFLPCESAFNGFAIYKIEKFINCHYEWKFGAAFSLLTATQVTANAEALSPAKLSNVPNSEDCEHRFFHFQARSKNNARIVISKHMIF